MGCGDNVDITWRNKRRNPAGGRLQQRLRAMQHQELLRKMGPAEEPKACVTTTGENNCVEAHTIACKRETNFVGLMISKECEKVNAAVETASAESHPFFRLHLLPEKAILIPMLTGFISQV